ncbi:tRNA-uridine aminocarboxypropyltransferase [Aliagarivorans marinus]|uniref:tRNA-uridine aminocarboxypropyltransferase n=1 Tax=Aliagarivorans marinus TaxID=561965 RepID=UPI00041AA769|nr:tRNA-uridine aminocarboxypropyltransferase [Aliagarivorans marinus]
MSRARCPHCQRPLSHCLCADISMLQHQRPVTILRHPSEQQHAKATAHLAALSLSRCELIDGEGPADFAAFIANSDMRRVGLIYPSLASQPLEQADVGEIDSWLFLDGTWRKAHKLLQLNPWLQSLPSFHFAHAPASAYTIRKAKRSDSLSTLEAIAYTLATTEQAEVNGLHQLQRALIEQQLQAMPSAVRQRYREL